MVMIVALNDKQKRFFQEYLIDTNATQAAIRAGYSQKTAYSQGQRLLKNVEGQKLLQEMMAEKEKELIAGQDEVLKYITAVMRADKSAYVIGDDGEEIADKPPDTKERLKAAELLGRRYGMFTDKVSLEGKAKVVIVDDLADE